MSSATAYFPQGFPIVLSCLFNNKSDAPVTLDLDHNLTEGFEVFIDDVFAGELLGANENGLVPGSETKIGPHKSYSKLLTLSIGNGAPYKAGVHKITGKLKGTSYTFETEIKVRALPADEEAKRYLISLLKLAHLNEGGMFTVNYLVALCSANPRWKPFLTELQKTGVVEEYIIHLAVFMIENPGSGPID